MGGSSKTDQQQQQQSISQPWAPAQGLLGGILGQLGGSLDNTGLTGAENNALAGLGSNVGYLGQFAPQLGNAASQFVGGGADSSGMINDAYQKYQSQLAPTASGQYLDPNSNPFFSQVTSTIGNDVQNRLAGLYAGSGRDPAGAGSFGQNLARGISEGVAPVFANAYNAERQNQLGAIGGLFSGAGQTAGLLSNLDQARLATAQGGAGLAQTAQGFTTNPFSQQLALEAMRRNIPLSNLQQIAQLGIPIAGLGGQTNTTGTATKTQDLPWYSWMQPVGSLFGGAGQGASGAAAAAAFL